MTDQLSEGVVQPTDAQIDAAACEVWGEQVRRLPRAAAIQFARAVLALAVPQAPLQAEPVPVVASEPDMSINGEPANAHSLLAALIDIHDDAETGHPDERCYVPEAWGDTLRMARRFLAAPQPEPVASEQLYRRVPVYGGHGHITEKYEPIATPQAEPAVAEQAREAIAQVVAVHPPGPDGPEVNWLGKAPKPGTLLYTAASSSDAAQQFEFVDAQNHFLRREMKRIANELRWYNPAADQYKGAHIHGVWARELDAALASQSTPPPAEQAEPTAREQQGVMRLMAPGEFRAKYLNDASCGTPPPESAGQGLSDAEKYQWLCEQVRSGPLVVATSDGYYLKSWSGDNLDGAILAANPKAQPDGGSKA